MIIQGKPHEKEEIFNTFHPLVAEWFKTKYSDFTPPQRYAIMEAFKGNNVLVSSPTGSGKTLAAFLTAINMLIEIAEKNNLEKRVYALYISPLKALNNDIKRNLEEPLSEIYQLAEEKGVKLQKIRIGVRTGDTDTSEKQKQLRNPPHILITTPETFSIILASPKFSQKLTRVKFLIIDEVHSLAENKRGTYLSLSMERLVAMQEEEVTRIGLSATIAPLEEIARFLVGNERDCMIVDVTFEKPIDIKVISPIEDFFGSSTSSEKISSKLYSILAGYVKSSQTVLIFTNTRSATERVVFHLKKILGEEYPVKAHHSSLSKDIRLEVEDNLKSGELRCVVSSTSLELGIDIGTIDLVILLGSPKSINRALQRIGRSGHRLSDTSKGIIVVVDHDDLVECTVLAKEALDRNLDRIVIPEKPLDVLAQHIVGMAIEKKWNIGDAHNLIRKAYPYRNLTKEEFVGMLKYLSGYSELEKKRVYGKIWFDEELGEFGRRGKLIRPIYYLNTGTIPDEVAIKVATKDKKIIGKVEEQFAEKLVKGDIFVLAGRTLRFLHSRGTRIIVEEVEGEKPTVPSWFSEQLPLSYDLASRIREFRDEVKGMISSENRTVEYLMREYYLDKKAATAMFNYFKEQEVFSEVPYEKNLLIEVFEEKGKNFYAFHTLIGRKANSAIARVYAYRVGKLKKLNVQFSVNDNGFMLITDKKLKDEEIIDLFNENKNKFQEDLKEALDKTEVLRRRFRHVAVRSMMILRNYLGREKSVFRQQLSSDSILKLLKKNFPDFPVLKETYREIMEDSMDLKNALLYISELDKESIIIKRIQYPSPFALNIYILGEEDVVLMEDRRQVLIALHEKIMKSISEKPIVS